MRERSGSPSVPGRSASRPSKRAHATRRSPKTPPPPPGSTTSGCAARARISGSRTAPHATGPTARQPRQPAHHRRAGGERSGRRWASYSVATGCVPASITPSPMAVRRACPPGAARSRASRSGRWSATSRVSDARKPSPGLTASGGRHGQGRRRAHRRDRRARTRGRGRGPPRPRGRGRHRTARTAARKDPRHRADPGRTAPDGGDGGRPDRAARVRPRRAPPADPGAPAPREHELPAARRGGTGTVGVPPPPPAHGLARRATTRATALRSRDRRRARLRAFAPGARGALDARHARTVRPGGRDAAADAGSTPRSRSHARDPGDDGRGAGGPGNDRALSRARRPARVAGLGADRERRTAAPLRVRRRGPAREPRRDPARPSARRGGPLRARAAGRRHGPGRHAPAHAARGTGWPSLPLRRTGQRSRHRPPRQPAVAGHRPRGVTLAELLASRRILLCVGSGGVGKTTTAAALALAAARRGRSVAVLTVDPSQRLKDALGLEVIDGKPHRVPLDPTAGGRLDAMLLDVKRTFDELVTGLASSPEQARRILDNRLYQNLSGTLAGTAEYMAVETVYRLVEEDRYDLVVVDTPPARHAVDFLDAPRRLLTLLDSRAFAILKDPTSSLPGAGSRLAALVLTGVLRGLERFTGIGLVREIGDFVRVIEDLTGALRARVAQVDGLLKSEATSLVLVTAPEPRLIAETEDLARALSAVRLRVHGVVVNRMLPRAVYGADAAAPAPLLGITGSLATRLERGFTDLRTLAARQEATLAPLLRTAGAPLLAEVPLLTSSPGSLADLDTVASHLLPEAPPVSAPAEGVGR